VSLVIAILLALFLLPWPWGGVAVIVAAVWESATALVGFWWTSRRPHAVGAEALSGMTAEVVSSCRPLGQVRVRGEIWQARCEQGAAVGESVRVTRMDGLTLVVEPATPGPGDPGGRGAP
jgi:membrane-bound serine protease (ClpP class)